MKRTLTPAGAPKRDLRFRAFFYDGSDYETGQMIKLNEAVCEDYVGWDGCTLGANDECTIIMQSTGCRDVKGTEIFEGDIVYLAGVGYCAVVFSHAAWAFENKSHLIFFNETEWSDVGNIMGTIFTHSKLLPTN